MNTQLSENYRETGPAHDSEPIEFHTESEDRASPPKPEFYFAVRNLDSPSDPNIKFYTNAPSAYAELERRERYGIFADLQTKPHFDFDVARELVNFRGES